jgi:predicted permease
LATLLSDVRYCLRSLRRTPGFTAIAVLTLALGIGANTALFSVVNGVLLNPLPFPHPDQLVTLHESKPNFEQGSISYPNFLDWQQQNHTFSAMAISRSYRFTLTGAGDAQEIEGEYISSDFFRLLGVKPQLGRTFGPGEDRIGAAPLALLGATLWERKFGSDPHVLGHSITLDGRSYTIVGVIPSGFHLAIPSFHDRQLYLPIGQWKNSMLPNRAAGLGIHGIARLKPGVTIQQARADMMAVSRQLAAAFPEADKGISARILPLREQMVGRVQPLLLVLLGAVGFVLLIACVNVANLLLARSSTRTREFAVRTALGASQARVIRQLVTESLLLAVAGGALGLLFAAWGTRAALTVLPSALPRAEEIGLDARVLFYTLVIALLAGILPGITPALLTISKRDLQECLQQGGRAFSATRHVAQSLFVVGEIALALVLLTGAGLMVRSLVQLWRIDPGFNPHNVLFFNVSLPPSMINAPASALRAAFRQLETKLSSTPNVRAVSFTWGAVPMAGDDEQLFWLAGQPKPANENDMNWALNYTVAPSYLDVMQIPLRRGRFFTAHDDEHSPGVAVIDDAFVRKFFPHTDPIGQRLNLNYSHSQVQIIGVVQHVKQWGLDSDDANSLRAQLYLPFMQSRDEAIAGSLDTGVVLRSDRSSPTLLDDIRHSVRQLSSENVVYGAVTMDEIVAASLAARRFTMILLAVFAALALTLAAIGVYGVISYVVGERTREIGIRIALGAHRREILRLVLTRGAKLATSGVIIGIVAAVGLTRLLSGLLYGVAPTDVGTFAAVTALLTAIALAACYLPARRAAKVDPIVALRN